ncbi:hypothetical protein PYW07_008469 [Mythimna separata]|uniref:Citrate transporter-like domain-containing protein n=1 Tax=Mythimna separata TaxID=271217 RepID=A0AAD8DP16_MYTSE|nr:hypothetical protein PYW07_008469 [Mythimna separata]
MVVFWTLDVQHPAVLAVMPIGLSCVMTGIASNFIKEMYIRNDLLDCLGVMMITIAIENSNVHRRLALKLLLMFGCSHYRIFPVGPKIEFPHFMLLNLPGVLVMETLLYLWMNFNFLGMFRSRSSIEIGMTEEEAQYVDALLATQYQQLGKLRFHELVVSAVVVLAGLLQATVSTARIDQSIYGTSEFHEHFSVSSPCVMCVILLFLLPVNLDFIKYFKRSTEGRSEPLPTTPTKSCLSWNMVRRDIHWSILLIIAGSSTLFESLRDSRMNQEFEQFLMIFEGWHASVIVFIVVLFCKTVTECATNSCVVYSLLPSIAKVSVFCNINPHYLMMAATLASSLPFHLMTGTPVNAMVCTYVHIPPWKLMYAGIGPSIIAIVVIWFTVVVWSTAIWTDITLDPDWADVNIFKIPFRSRA